MISFSKYKREKKLLIILIIVANLLFVWSVFDIFYYKKASFNITEKAKINSKIINQITNGDGSWNWDGREYDFYKTYSFSLTENEINEFCRIINSSNAKYIENIRPKNWLDIYIEEKSGIKETITLKLSYEHEIYFEIEEKTFEEKKLAEYIKKHIEKN